MHKLMRTLRQDHLGLRKLLALLAHKLQRLQQGIPPNYALIEDAINYIENHVSRYHHPTEDVLYRYAIEHGLDEHKHFATIMAEHKTLIEQTQTVKSSLQSILMDIIIPREEFIGQLKDYIQAEQSHMDKEDSLIFPLLDKLLHEDDWLKITNRLPEQLEDPLFGKGVQQEFQNLYKRLAEIEDV